jgi:hypothetical protein
MRKISRMIAAVATSLLLVAAMPLTALASTWTTEWTDYATLYPDGCYNVRNISNLGGTWVTGHASEPAELSNIKSSKPGVAKASVTKASSKMNTLSVKAKKSGSTYISFKLNGKKVKQKLVVKNYVNPFKKITVNGKNVTSRFDGVSVITLSYEQYKGKTVTIKWSGKKNWSVSDNTHSSSKRSFTVTEKTDVYFYCQSSKYSNSLSALSESVYIRFV